VGGKKKPLGDRGKGGDVKNGKALQKKKVLGPIPRTQKGGKKEKENLLLKNVPLEEKKGWGRVTISRRDGTERKRKHVSKKTGKLSRKRVLDPGILKKNTPKRRGRERGALLCLKRNGFIKKEGGDSRAEWLKERKAKEKISGKKTGGNSLRFGREKEEVSQGGKKKKNSELKKLSLRTFWRGKEGRGPDQKRETIFSERKKNDSSPEHPKRRRLYDVNTPPLEKKFITIIARGFSSIGEREKKWEKGLDPERKQPKKRGF